MDSDCAVWRDWVAHERGLTMGDFEIDILMNRSKGMRITTNGTGEDILKGLSIAAIEVTANIDAKNAKALRGILCDMIMSAPTKVN